MRIKPLHDKILILREAPAKQSDGGIFIPETARNEKKPSGKVMAVGAGKEFPRTGKVRKLAVKVGERVFFDWGSAREVHNDGDKQYLIIREDDILGVVS